MVLFCVLSDTGTKTLVVHGQNECDIPTQLPVHEDTQFEALLKVLNIVKRVNNEIGHYYSLTDLRKYV